MTIKVQIPPANAPVIGPDGNLALEWRSFFNDLLSRAGGVLGGLQPASANLDGLSSLDASAGLVVQTGASAFTKRSLGAVAGRTVATNPTGAAGNPTIDLAPVAGVAGVHANPTSITLDGYGRVVAIAP